MQAVILAAGRSTRTWPLTVRRPKPLLKVLNRTVLDRNLDQLAGLVDEVVVVVGFEKDRIVRQFQNGHKSLRLRFVEQEQPMGTGHALLSAKPYLGDRFLVMNGDDLFSRSDLERLLRYRYAALAMDVPDARPFGVHVVEGNRIVNHVEKPLEAGPGRCNVGCYVFDQGVFDIELRPSPRGELEITDYLSALAQRTEVRSVAIEGYWLPMPFAWKLLDATEFLLGPQRDGRVVKDEGSEIERATLRGFAVIGRGCKVGASVVEDSVLMDNVRIGDGCEIRNCILGEDTVLGDGVKAFCESEGNDIRSRIKGEWVHTGRRRLGAIAAENVIIEDGAVTLPGVKIWPDVRVAAGTRVAADIGGWEE